MRWLVLIAAAIGCGKSPSSITGDAAGADATEVDAAIDAPSHPMPTAEPPDPVGAPCAGRLGFPDLPTLGLSLYSPRLMRAGDVTGDGHVDLLLLQGATVSVAAGNGNGTFAAAPITTSFGTAPTTLVLRDVNGDGKLDLVFTTTDQLSASTTIQVALNAGAGTFGTPTAYDTSLNVLTVDAADVNSDGKTDLLALERFGHRMVVLLATNSGFAAPALYSVATGAPDGFELADVTGDGAIDAIVVDANASTFNVVANKGNGTFAAPVSYAINAPSALAVVDINHDGKRDVVVAGTGSPGQSVISARLAQNNGTLGGAIESVIAHKSTSVYSPANLSATDVDGDGDVDLVGTGISGVPIQIALGDDAGHFTSTAAPLDTEVNALAVADFDGDTKPDLALGTSTAGILTYRNRGGAQPFEFPTTQALPNAYRLWSARTVDMNSDGVLDVLTIDYGDHTAYAVMATAPGHFTGTRSAVQLNVDGKFSGLADFNNDGRQDLFSAGYDGPYTYSGARVVLNQGDGTLAAGAVAELPFNIKRPERAAAGDLDNDGIRDLVITARVDEYAQTSTAYFAHGLGNGSFSAPTQIWSGAVAYGAAIGDIDGDGNADVLLDASPSNGANNELVILPGLGNGGFMPAITSNLHGLRIALRDVNHDGKLDLVSWLRGVEVELGQGGLNFGPPMQATSKDFYELNFADFDGNGTVDIVGGGENFATILLGRGDGTFVENGSYFVKSEYGDVWPTDLDGDGHLDLLVGYEDHVTTILGHCY